MSDERMKIAILGCTGSVGTQTLQVCREYSDRLEVVALAAKDSYRELLSFAREFKVPHLALADERLSSTISRDELPEGTELRFGDAAVTELAKLDGLDCVVNAIVGAAGIDAAMAAAQAGVRIAYANKESIVVAGELILPLCTQDQLIPVDSEHSAIFQCLQGKRSSALKRIWLTCSGGPFFGMSRDELASKSAQEALKHPKWNMGDKLTIDSATLANKGLELIEAERLFNVDIDDVRVLVHPQSRIHSMVEFSDGACIAQLGKTSMRVPIMYSLSFPERWESDESESLDWRFEEALQFAEADEEVFPALSLAREAGRSGKTAPCIFNAANEVANEAYLANTCGFYDIPAAIEEALSHFSLEDVDSIEQLKEVDRSVRTFARTYLEMKV